MELVHEIQTLPIDKLTPYEKNARRHAADDVDAIAASIQEFGFSDPIGVWGDRNLIVEGHGRLLAAKKLGMTEVPCIRLDHLSDSQRKAYALAHNRTAELSDWDAELLTLELGDISDIDMTRLGFDFPDGEEAASWFDREHKDGAAREEGNEDYNEFLDKFEAKKTTDDCYTPDNVYDAVADWVAKEYKLDRKNFRRPFYPGGDYQREQYAETDIVVDNPPFSILAEIVSFYAEHGVRFFLFAPALTLFSSSSSSSACAVCCKVAIVYENGASVSTSFLTNLEPLRFRTAPDLYAAVRAADEANAAGKTRPGFTYPVELVTPSILGQLSRYGVYFGCGRESTARVCELDAQRDAGASIYGNGYLISERKANELREALRIVDERKEAERQEAEKKAAEKRAEYVWTLSDREREIVRSLI